MQIFERDCREPWDEIQFEKISRKKGVGGEVFIKPLDEVQY
jgi:hypothetical protein